MTRRTRRQIENTVGDLQDTHYTAAPAELYASLVGPTDEPPHLADDVGSETVTQAYADLVAAACRNPRRPEDHTAMCEMWDSMVGDRGGSS